MRRMKELLSRKMGFQCRCEVEMKSSSLRFHGHYYWSEPFSSNLKSFSLSWDSLAKVAVSLAFWLSIRRSWMVIPPFLIRAFLVLATEQNLISLSLLHWNRNHWRPFSHWFIYWQTISVCFYFRIDSINKLS